MNLIQVTRLCSEGRGTMAEREANMNKTAAGYSLVIVSGILFGLTPIFSKVLYGQGMNVLSLLAQRNIITIVLLFFLIHFLFLILSVL